MNKKIFKENKNEKKKPVGQTTPSKSKKLKKGELESVKGGSGSNAWGGPGLNEINVGGFTDFNT